MGELVPPSVYSKEEKMAFEKKFEALMTKGSESQTFLYEQIEDVLVSIEDRIKQVREKVREEVTRNYAKFNELMLLLREVDELSQNSLIERLEICFKNGHWVETSTNTKQLEEIKDRVTHLFSLKFSLDKIKKIGIQHGVNTLNDLPEVTNNSTSTKTIFDPFLVHVSFVKDPGEFYIVRLCDEERRNLIFASLKSMSETLPHPESIKTGQMYAVLNNGNIWCRGVCGSQCGHAQVGDNPIETLYEFFFLDQGHYELIPSLSIKVLPADLIAHPPLAIECTLNQLNPVKFWTAQATTLFKKLTKQGPLDLMVFSQEGNVLNVDLAQIPRFADQGHILSVRDALFFTQSNSPQSEAHSLCPRPGLVSRRFPPVPGIEVGSKLTGVITRAISPFLMFVQTDSTEEEKYQTMSEEMQTEYNNLNSDSPMAVRSPSRGKIYAVRYMATWHRVILEEVKTDGSISAYCVDNGYYFTSCRKDLRILHDKYTVLPPQVIHCKLEGVKTQGNGEAGKFSQHWLKDFMKQFNGIPVTLLITAIIKVSKFRSAAFATKMYTKDALTSLNKEIQSKYDSWLAEVNSDGFQHEKSMSSTRQLPAAEPLPPKKEDTNTASIVSQTKETSTEPNATNKSTGSHPASVLSVDLSELDSPPVETPLLDSSSVGTILSSLPDSPPDETPVLDSSAVGTTDQKATSTSTSSATDDESSVSKKKLKQKSLPVARTSAPGSMIFDDISPLLENPVRGSDYARSDGVVNVSGSLPEDEISLNVCFVHCHSPDSIFFRMPHHTKVYQEMMAKLDFVYSNYKREQDLKFEVNFACVVQNHGEYFRAEVIDIDEYPRCMVRLMDIGQIIHVQVADVFPLLAPFDQIPRLAIHCSLHGIYPPEGVWNNHVQKRITELLFPAKEISICKRQPLKSSSPLSVMLIYMIKSEGGPLELPGLKWINLNEQLVELKLALDHPDHLCLSTGAAPTWKEPAVVKFLPRFNGTVTWVNLAGEVFLYDVNKSEFQLRYMQEQLYSIYEGSQPSEADLNCKAGDPCIARYELDGKWYRATVAATDIDENKVEVIFVDYGTRDDVDRHHIRLNVMLQWIPIQTIKCTIHNIQVPGTKADDVIDWPIQTLDYLHKLIVDQTCCVKVHAQSSLANVVSLTLPSGVDVADHLVAKKLAEFVQVKTKPVKVKTKKQQLNHSKK